MFADLTENQLLMLMAALFILWFFLQLTKESFDPGSYNAAAHNDIEQAGRKKWRYMHDWVINGVWN